MKINISKINFKGSGNNGGGGCVSLLNYTESENINALTDINNAISYTNSLYNEWDVNNTSANALYSGHTQLVYAPAIDTNNVTDMYSMFTSCTNLKYIPTYNTSKVIKMGNMFNGCNKLTTIYGINDWDTSNVNNMSSMFGGCYALTSLDLSKWDVSKVTNTTYMFQLCSGLTSLNLSNWDLRNVTDMSYMFNNYGTFNLTDLILDNAVLPNINLAYTRLNMCNKLSVDSLIGILNALPITTSNYTLTLGSTNLNKLTDEQKSIATNKGWTLN